MIETQRLRQKILDLAIRGKLVPQDPADEPASALLKRIHQEKLQMVADGRLKKKDVAGDSIIYRGEDNLHYEKVGDSEPVCIEAELPFELPAGWAWTRGSGILSLANGIAKRRGDGLTPTYVLRLADLTERSIALNNLREINLSDDDREKYSLHQGDLLFIRVNGSRNNVGKSYIVGEYDRSVAYCDHLIRGKVFGNNPQYLQRVMGASFTRNRISNQIVSAAGQNTISQGVLASLLLPIPPCAEQHRIVEVLDRYLALVDDIERNQAELDELLAKARSKVLDLAIRGKLVPQNPADEPASVLLKRIHQEKLQMVADGRLGKKDVAGDSVIYRGEDNSYYEKVGDHEPICIENDLPFDLPQGWTWARIGTAFVMNPRNDALDSTTASFVPMSAIDPDFTNIIHPEQRPWKAIKRGFTHFADGDIVFSKISPCFENGKCFIASSLTNGIGSGTTELFVLRPVDNSLERNYVFDFLSSRTFILGATKTFMGTVGQQRVKRKYVEQSLLPVPPKNEQMKICTMLSAFAQLLHFE